jgi:chromosome segregation ATPase
MSDEKLDLILKELKELKTDVKELKEGQNSLKKDVKDLSIITGKFAERFDKVDIKLKDLDNRSEILLSDIQGVSKKLDRQIASSRSNSAKFRELEMRVEDLEVSPPTV